MSLHRLRPALRTWAVRRNYSSYRSPYGPAYKTQPQVNGIDPKTFTNYAIIAGGIAGSLGFYALFVFAEVPRVSQDIMQKIPFIGDFFVKEVAPEDNPF